MRAYRARAFAEQYIRACEAGADATEFFRVRGIGRAEEKQIMGHASVLRAQAREKERCLAEERRRGKVTALRDALMRQAMVDPAQVTSQELVRDEDSGTWTVMAMAADTGEEIVSTDPYFRADAARQAMLELMCEAVQQVQDAA